MSLEEKNLHTLYLFGKGEESEASKRNAGGGSNAVVKITRQIY